MGFNSAFDELGLMELVTETVKDKRRICKLDLRVRYSLFWDVRRHTLVVS